MTKLIPRYQHGNPFLIDKSSIPGTSPQTSSTINYDWNRQAKNKEAIKQTEKEKALQQYLDRRGYISEDKDKRNYAQRDVDDKINATKNAKTDFYSMDAPNAQSTDITPRQVILPSLLAGFTAAAPLTSLATGAMYEPMEKYGLYKPVSLGLQKLGVNEKTAETLSPFITDPFIWSIPSLSKRLTNNNFTRSYLVSRELNRGIKQATKQGDIRVQESYFNNPDKWYRVTETPEVHGIEQSGRNVTTKDIEPGTIQADDFRRTVGENGLVAGTGENEGYWILKPEKFNMFKGGQAHGNTSQAAKGQIWQGTFAKSGKFPTVILEGEGNKPTFRGMTREGHDSRSHFILQNWEDIPQGARLGFHTGEMPLDNLRWFQRNPDGTFTFKGSLLPETRISFNPRGELNAPTLNEANEVATLKNDYNTFAQRYHYKHYHGPEDIQSLKQASQELADRHHTFFRGVIPPTKDEDLQKLLDLGIYGLEDQLQYAATHPKFNLKLNGEGVWMTPTHKAFAYGRQGSTLGKVALVRVPYTKNSNRPLYNLDLGQIIDPNQSSFVPTTNQIPREVVYTGNTPLEFLGWAPKYQKGLVSKIRVNNFGK